MSSRTVPVPSPGGSQATSRPAAEHASPFSVMLSRAPASLSATITAIAQLDRELDDLLTLRKMEKVVNLTDGQRRRSTVDHQHYVAYGLNDESAETPREASNKKRAANGSSTTPSVHTSNGGTERRPTNVARDEEAQMPASSTTTTPSGVATFDLSRTVENSFLMGLLGIPKVAGDAQPRQAAPRSTPAREETHELLRNSDTQTSQPLASPAEKRSGDSVEALRREIMGEVKHELMLEVQRRDRENMNKLSDLERENLTLRQELMGLLREIRDEKKQKRRERKRAHSDESEDEPQSEEETQSRQVVEQPRKAIDKGKAKADQPEVRRTRRRRLATGQIREPEQEQQAAPVGQTSAGGVEAPPSEIGTHMEKARARDENRAGEEPAIKVEGLGDSTHTARRAVKKKHEGKRTSETIEQENELRWQIRIDELRAFVAEHGTWRVPKNFSNKPLYTWTQNVRQRWRRGTLPEKKLQDLLNVGMTSPFDEQEQSTTHQVDVDARASSSEQSSSSSNCEEKKVSGRPRAVKKAKKQRPAPASSEEGHSSIREARRKSESDEEYTLASDQEDDSIDDSLSEDAEDADARSSGSRRKRMLRRSLPTVAQNAAIKRRTKSLGEVTTEKRKREEYVNNSTDDDDSEEEEEREVKKPKIEEGPSKMSEHTLELTDEQGAIPDNPANQKWFERYDALKKWVHKHGPGRPNRKQSPSLGRWADQQLCRLKAGDLLPWRRKLLEEVGFFNHTDE